MSESETPEGETLDCDGRAWRWQRDHDVSADEAARLADELPTVDPRRRHYAALMLDEWRAGRPPETSSDWAIAYRDLDDAAREAAFAEMVRLGQEMERDA